MSIFRLGRMVSGPQGYRQRTQQGIVYTIFYAFSNFCKMHRLIPIPIQLQTPDVVMEKNCKGGGYTFYYARNI